MTLDIKASREICVAATEGPWLSTEDEGPYVVLAPRIGLIQVCVGAVERDATFIAYARTAFPEALNEIETLRKQVAKLESAIKRMP